MLSSDIQLESIRIMDYRVIKRAIVLDVRLNITVDLRRQDTVINEQQHTLSVILSANIDSVVDITQNNKYLFLCCHGISISFNAMSTA